MKLPNIDRAVLDPSKIRDYLLSKEHPVGRFKAAFFGSLVHAVKDWERLRDDLLQVSRDVDVVMGQASDFGQKYEIRGRLEGPSGRSAEVVLVWMILHEEDVPRFITAYPGGK